MLKGWRLGSLRRFCTLPQSESHAGSEVCPFPCALSAHWVSEGSRQGTLSAKSSWRHQQEPCVGT